MEEEVIWKGGRDYSYVAIARGSLEPGKERGSPAAPRERGALTSP